MAKAITPNRGDESDESVTVPVTVAATAVPSRVIVKPVWSASFEGITREPLNVSSVKGENSNVTVQEADAGSVCPEHASDRIEKGAAGSAIDPIMRSPTPLFDIIRSLDETAPRSIVPKVNSDGSASISQVSRSGIISIESVDN